MSASGGLRSIDPLPIPHSPPVTHFPPCYKILAAPLAKVTNGVTYPLHILLIFIQPIARPELMLKLDTSMSVDFVIYRVAQKVEHFPAHHIFRIVQDKMKEISPKCS